MEAWACVRLYARVSLLVEVEAVRVMMQNQLEPSVSYNQDWVRVRVRVRLR